MKRRLATLLVLFPAICMGGQGQAQMSPEAVAAVQRPVEVERDEAVTSIPLAVHMGKIAITGRVNGIERQFIFDTGSPTMISRELATELGLTTIGSNTGRDANGRDHTTEVAIVEELRIGGIGFRNVPVLVDDFGIADPDGCFFDGGVIGSEIFPGSVWHIDAGRKTMQIAESFAQLADSGVADPILATSLHDFGYPHAPVFDYAIGSLSDRGLFDTGSPETIALFAGLMRERAVDRAVITGSKREGLGSEGVSAAGPGPTKDLLLFDIDGIRLGDGALGRHRGTIRGAPPSLIGAGILDTYDVTLDYPGSRLMLHPRVRPEPEPGHPGYALTSIDGEVRVTQLFEGSRADKAGLRLDDTIAAIDGVALSPGDAPCETMRFLVEDRPTRNARRLTVMREGLTLEIDLAGELDR